MEGLDDDEEMEEEEEEEEEDGASGNSESVQVRPGFHNNAGPACAPSTPPPACRWLSERDRTWRALLVREWAGAAAIFVGLVSGNGATLSAGMVIGIGTRAAIHLMRFLCECRCDALGPGG